MRSATRKRTGEDADYLQFIAGLPCVACDKTEALQGGRSECAHIGNRGLSQKCPDRETIPLCARHHRTGTYALHRLGKNWWTLHGIDKDALVKELNERYEKEKSNGCS